MREALKGFLIGIVVAMVAASVARAADDDSDQRFLAGLRGRGLYRLAETYCLETLGDSALSDARRAELVVELSLTLSDRAAASPPDGRAPLWDRAWQVTEAFAEQYPASPRRPLVRYQGTLALVARGELAREESELAADNQATLEESRTALRTAIRQLEQLSADVTEQLRAAGAPGRSIARPAMPDALAEYELAAMEKNLRYQLARAFRNQAECYPPSSPDRTNSLTRALGLLEPLAELDAAEPVAFKSRLAEIDCYRLLGDLATAGRKLGLLIGANPPPAVGLEARALAIRLALAAGGLQQALAVAAEGRTLDGRDSPKLDYAALQAYLEAWQAAHRAGDASGAAAWQSKASDALRLIQREHGPYWTRRGEMLLASFVRTSSGGDLAMQVRAAESSFRSGQLDNAVADYDRACRLAQEQGDADQAFELAYTAATIEHQRNRHAEAMARFRALATARPSHAKAAESHLLAVYHAEQLVKAEPSPDALRQYAELLQEHLAHWPQGDTSDDVRWRLGRFCEHRQDHGGAIAAFRAIAPEFDRREGVVEGAARAYHAWLDQQAAAGKAVEPAVAEAARWFESNVCDAGGQLPETWTPAQRIAALEAARLWVDYTASGYGRAEEFLLAALESPGDASPEWTSAARAMLDRLKARALAGAGRADEALAVYRHLAEKNPHDGNIQEAYARLLSARPDRASLEAALGRWRYVESKSQPQSEPWYRAKYAVASLHLRLGNREQAERMIKLLEVLHPEMGGPAMKARFDDLLRRAGD